MHRDVGLRRVGFAVAALLVALFNLRGCIAEGAAHAPRPASREFTAAGFGWPTAFAQTAPIPSPTPLPTPSSTAAVSATQASINPACRDRPLPGRDLFLRGPFNSWNADERFRFTWICNRFELVARLDGDQQFKVGDEAWSRDADFGGPIGPPMTMRRPDFSAGKPVPVVPVGQAFAHRFSGNHRLTLSYAMSIENPATPPTLSISTCDLPPLGDRVIFLRGTMNNWASLDDYAFQFSCDAYYLNVKLTGRHDFKIGDAAWSDAATFGTPGGAAVTPQTDRAESLDAGRGVGNLGFGFSGEQTLRLAFPGGRPMLTIGAKSFADPSAKAVTDPVALSLTHDSRQISDRSPFGAVTAGTSVQFAVGSLPGVERIDLVIEKRRLEGNQDVLEYTEIARLPMSRSTDASKPGRERWQASHRFADVAIHGYHFEARIGGKAYVLQNNRDAIHWTREKGSNGLAAVDDQPASARSIRRLRITVYAADFKVPSWARDVVYYYIFPDRYRNGNPANDPKPGRDTYQDKPVEKHANWLDKPYRPNSGDGSDAVYNNDFFGGDLAGIIDKLDDIRDLGANTIYMTPIFRASSNHKYDTADFRHIDPAFGTDADFERLTREAKQRGIRVIVDTSLNHVGADSIYFDRFGKYESKGAFEGGRIQPDSPYASWFSFDPTQANPDRQFKGWVGINDLPELDKSSASFRNFAYRDRDSVMNRWLDRGAAGWRMDVAPWVPDDFWREWRTAIKTHKPDALTVSEAWFDSSKFFLGDMFDSTMNYIFRNAVLDYAGGGKAVDLVKQLEFLREAYPPPAFYALMNLTSSHDVARSLHVLGDLGDKTPPEKVAEAKRRLLLTVFLQMTHPGAPTVYYGDEVGVTGGEDPYNRATYPWADLGGNPDMALRAEFKRLIAMRHQHAVLRHGESMAPMYVDENVVVFGRRLGSTWAISAVNNALDSRSVTVPLPAGSPQAWRDAMSGDEVRSAGGPMVLKLESLAGRVLISR